MTESNLTVPETATPAKREGREKIHAHVRCGQCGYDLFGLGSVGTCPECGYLIWLSLFGRHLDRRWLARFTRQVWALMALHGLLLVVPCLLRRVEVVLLLEGMVLLLGAWVMHDPQVRPGLSHTGMNREWRLVWLGGVGMVVGLMVAAMIESRMRTGLASGGLIVVGFGRWMLWMRFSAIMGRGLTDQGAVLCACAGWFAFAATTVFGLGVSIMWLGGFSPASPVGVSLLFALLLWLGSLWSSLVALNMGLSGIRDAFEVIQSLDAMDTDARNRRDAATKAGAA